MVEIREEPSDSNEGAGTSGSQRAAGDNTHAGQMSLIDYLKSRSVDSVLFGARLVTVLCTLYYLLPVGTPNAQLSAYSKTFAAAAATNALRLHQRVGGVRFSREFLSEVIPEDSFHYLIYSVLFLTTAPVTMALLPVFLFALLHAANFSVQACTACGWGSSLFARKVSQLTTQHTQNLLGVIACSEVFLMPLLILMIFSGQASIFLPFMYYRFITLRYMSRRNNTTKLVFYQLRMWLQQTVCNPNCPQFVSAAAYRFINFVCWMCPTTA